MNPGEPISSTPALPPEPRMQAVWRERADRLARRPSAAGAARDATPVIVLGIGKERYGIDVAEVAEILPPVRATPVPGAAAVFAGVINVHGEIRPVIDLRRWLGIAGADAMPAGEPARVVLLRRNGREIGLQIDSVEPLRWIGPGDVRANGSSLRHKGSTDPVMLLSTEALFAELETGGNT